MEDAGFVKGFGVPICEEQNNLTKYNQISLFRQHKVMSQSWVFVSQQFPSRDLIIPEATDFMQMY